MNELLLIVVIVAAASILPPLFLYWVAARPRLVPYFVSFGNIEASLFGVVGVLFSLNLAFICNEIWQNRELATAAMSREGEALRNLARIAANIPNRGGLPILTAARQYLEVVVHVDFPLASAPQETRSDAPEASSLPALIALSDTLLDGNTLEKIHPAVRSLALGQLAAVRDKRLERVALTNFEANRVKWLALIFLQAMVVVAIFFVHARNPLSVLVATMVFLVSVNPFVTILYMSQSPFVGLNPLTSVRLDAALERLIVLEASVKGSN